MFQEPTSTARGSMDGVEPNTNCFDNRASHVNFPRGPCVLWDDRFCIFFVRLKSGMVIRPGVNKIHQCCIMDEIKHICIQGMDRRGQ